MTAKKLWEATLSEMNKVNAPSILLEDFIYFVNRAINQVVNKTYNIYDINQQTTDNLRVLKSTAILNVTPATDFYGNNSVANSYLGNTYVAQLPTDYLHLLNCVCDFKVKGGDYKCYKDGSNVQFAATRCTADIWGVVLNNFYMKPSYKKPYYYINNAAYFANTEPLESYSSGIQRVTEVADANPKLTNPSTASELKRDIALKDNNGSILSDTTSLVERTGGLRYGNSSVPTIEIRYGKDRDTFELERIYIDYIKAPQWVTLTQEEIDTVRDTSQILEFPDYVCQEIVNELVTILMENASDPRLQTHIPVSQSIASPAQQQTQSNN